MIQKQTIISPLDIVILLKIISLKDNSEYVTSECHNRFLNDLSAKERYLQVLENESDLLQRVPLNYLSTYLQVTPETLSRIRLSIART